MNNKQFILGYMVGRGTNYESEGQIMKVFIKRFYLFIFRERGREEEREGEKHRLVASLTYPDQGLNCNPGTCPDRQLKQQPFTL